MEALNEEASAMIDTFQIYLQTLVRYNHTLYKRLTSITMLGLVHADITSPRLKFPGRDF